MSKFKIGDKVRIREDLNEYDFYDIMISRFFISI